MADEEEAIEPETTTVPTLPATAWAVLGLLSFGRELSGYDLKKWADSSLAFFYWSPAVSQIYAELKRLERVGFVRSRTVAQDELRNKRVYAITAAGKEAMVAWVHGSPVDPPVLKHGVLLRVWLGHLADPEELRSIVRQHRDYAASMIDELQSRERVAEAEPEWAYPDVVLRWGEKYYRSERDLADELLRDLEEVSARTSSRRTSRRR